MFYRICVQTLDGKDLRDLNTVSLRQLIGYVDKQPQLFNRTVAENIAYGDNINNVPMSRVVEIAKQLGMHNFFCSLPDVSLQFECNNRQLHTRISMQVALYCT